MPTANQPSRSTLDSPSLSCTIYGILMVVLSGAWPELTLPLLGGMLLLIPAYFISRIHQGSGYRLAWRITTGAFILLLLFFRILGSLDSAQVLVLISCFLLLHRWFNQRTWREHLQLWALSLLLVMTGAIHGGGFLGILVLFAWFTSSAVLLNQFALVRSALPIRTSDSLEEVASVASVLPVSDPAIQPRHSFRLMLGLLPLLLVMSVLLHPLVPRFPPRGFLPTGESNELVTDSAPQAHVGFTGHVNFHSISSIADDPGVALRVLDYPHHLSAGINRMRVATASHFDGWEWKPLPADDLEKIHAPGGSYSLAPTDNPMKFHGHVVRMVLEDYNSRFIPIPEGTHVIHGLPTDRDFFRNSDGRISSNSPHLPSMLSFEVGENGPALQPPTEADLEIPRLLENTVADLHAKVFEGAEFESPQDRIRHAAFWFRRNGVYTLDLAHLLPGPAGVRRFMSDSLRGHCEYFATAMVLILRADGIPARLVTGFNGGDPSGARSPNGVEILVRHRHAHAWVEAYSPATGWLAADPTPMGIFTTGIQPSTFLELGRSLGLQIATFTMFFEGWNYQQQRQWFVGHISRLRGMIAEFEHGALLRAWKRIRQNINEPYILALVISLLLVNLAAIAMHRRWERGREVKEKTLRQVGGGVIPQLLRELLGRQRLPGNVVSLGATDLIMYAWSAKGEVAEHVAELYERWRFASLTTQERNALEAELRACLRLYKKTR